MSNLLNAVIPALGWSLLHFLWQGLLIGCVAALLLHALRNARPQARYLVACMALFLCAALPLANFAWRLADAADTGYVLPAPLEASAIAAIPGAADGQGAEAALVDVDAMATWEYLLRRQMPWLVLLWAAGAALMTLRLSLGLQWVRTRTLPDHYHADAGWQARTTALARRMGIRRLVRLGVSDDGLEGPITAGILRPIVLLPASLVSGLPPDLLEALLAHELAHVRRHDYLVNLVQSGIEIFLFYHPSVWMLSQCIRREREQIADDLAASTLGEPRRLALALSELDKFQFTTNHFAAPAANGGDLMSRIKRLIRPDAQPLSWKMATPLLGIFAACAALYAHAMPQAVSLPAASAVTATAPAAAMLLHVTDAGDQHEVEPAPPAPPAPPAAAAPPAPPMAELAPPAPPAAPMAAVPAPPKPPKPPKPARELKEIESSSYISIDDNSRSAYAYVRDNDKHLSVNGFHGAPGDITTLKRLRQDTKGEFIYVRKNGKSYVIQDPVLLGKVRELWKPAEAQGKIMDEQGKLMDAQGKQVDAMSDQIAKEVEASMGSKEQQAIERAVEREMEKSARQQERIARAMEKAGRKMAMADDQTRAQLERDLESLRKQMEPLSEEMARKGNEIAARHAALAARQAPIAAMHARIAEASKPLHEMGRKMGELGREQGRLSREADKASRALIDEAINNGSAKPVM
ncbi:Signal transducer regulating beta-lactamase production, contains metallopeptidase domain [Duganella sp. CF458]|uniref:M56 family metallopeptidase n=1 Tax=Duganella sp. CF458 TaxID=1884368 RepID=UPI0008DFE119|nr:M56 family metallopeptidase [Duganella sp. CF458]SFG96628.1 Signal transducer regulating beta-lactamase production, contains metallopeptidase domain [Duganella sp. CF458]